MPWLRRGHVLDDCGVEVRADLLAGGDPANFFVGSRPWVPRIVDLEAWALG